MRRALSLTLKVQDLEFFGADGLLTKVSNQLHLTVIAVGRQNPMMSPPQVLEHRELATARQKDRLNGNGRSGDYGRQLVRDAARVGQVGDDKARQVSQG